MRLKGTLNFHTEQGGEDAQNKWLLSNTIGKSPTFLHVSANYTRNGRKRIGYLKYFLAARKIGSIPVFTPTARAFQSHMRNQMDDRHERIINKRVIARKRSKLDVRTRAP